MRGLLLLLLLAPQACSPPDAAVRQDAAPEGARPLDLRGLTNLRAFARLYGFVRWYHPSEEAEAADWEQVARLGVCAVEGAGDARDLALRLQESFAPFAPSVQVFPTGQAPEAPRLVPDGSGDRIRVRWWKHRGADLGFRKEIPIYSSRRVGRTVPLEEFPEDVPDPRQPFQADLPGGVSCRVPLGLFEADGRTFPPADPAAGLDHLEEVRALPPASAADRSTRLAAVIITWNAFQHFYPYFDVVDTDWPAALEAALVTAASDEGGAAFLPTLQRLVAAARDGHGRVVDPGNPAVWSLPLNWEVVEGEVVITRSAPAAEGEVAPGDVVASLDGAPATDRLAEAGELVSGATAQWRQHRALEELRLGRRGQEARLEVRSAGGRTRSVVLRHEVPPGSPDLKEPRPEPVTEIRPGIWYLDLDRAGDEDFQAALPRLQEARGILVDLRGYPNRFNTQALLARLTREPLRSAHWLVPETSRPDQEAVTWYRPQRWLVLPAAPRLEGKVAFLTGGGAISYAESTLSIVEHYRLAEIVGGPTAGPNGNINQLRLPGGQVVIFTGMRVLRHDGEAHHGRGVQPTVPVSRTIGGIAAGRDEVLERALQVVGG